MTVECYKHRKRGNEYLIRCSNISVWCRYSAILGRNIYDRYLEVWVDLDTWKEVELAEAISVFGHHPFQVFLPQELLEETV